MTELRIEGLEELLKILNKEIPQKIQPTAEREMQKAVKIVERKAKLYSPLDKGHLQSSIASEVQTTFGEVQGIIGSPLRYAAKMEELGHVIIRKKTSRSPYLRPAVEENKEKIIDNFKRAFEKLFASIKR